MSSISKHWATHWSNSCYIWQRYLAKQLLVPLVTNIQDDKLYLVSVHHISEFKCIEIAPNQFAVRVILNNGKKYYFATMCETYHEALTCYEMICKIGLGDLEITVEEWLQLYPRFVNNFEIIEWN